jgi:predicted metal-binding membrane protein
VAVTEAADARAERLLFLSAFGAVVGGAWLALGLVGGSPWAGYLHHQVAVDDTTLPYLARVALFVGGWTVMSIAMMLPSSLPLVTLFRTVTRRRPRPGRAVALLGTGYLALWALFGLAVFVADTGLHRMMEATGLFGAYERWLVAATLVLAGLFQFAPLKYACLSQCRSPVGFLASHWHGGDPRWGAFALGLRHGLFCIGCCWALMLLMFAVGGVNLGWMLVLAALMFAEKAVSWGGWVTAPTGVALTGWGLALALGLPVPSP